MVLFRDILVFQRLNSIKAQNRSQCKACRQRHPYDRQKSHFGYSKHTSANCHKSPDLLLYFQYIYSGVKFIFTILLIVHIYVIIFCVRLLSQTVHAVAARSVMHCDWSKRYAVAMCAKIVSMEL